LVSTIQRLTGEINFRNI